MKFLDEKIGGWGETFICAAAPPLCGTLCVNNMEINELNFSGEADDTDASCCARVFCTVNSLVTIWNFFWPEFHSDAENLKIGGQSNAFFVC